MYLYQIIVFKDKNLKKLLRSIKYLKKGIKP